MATYNKSQLEQGFIDLFEKKITTLLMNNIA